jgi:hypothetical protein
MDSRYFDKPAVWLLGLWLILLPCHVLAAPLRLIVHDPYLDLHTGPGRGYPIVQSVARDSEIEIEHSSTDWYRVRTDHTAGWVHRQQLQKTLAAAGIQEDGRAALMERHIDGRLMAGMNAGVFDSDPVIGFWGGYRITPAWAAEAAIAQAAGSYSSTRMYRLEALARPWPGLSYPPHLILGVGYFENRPRQTLVESGTEDALAFTVGLGASKQLEPRLALRADWRWHHARFNSDNDNFHEFTVGFALLF